MQEIQLKKNDEVVVVIDRLGVNGEGIGKANGKIIFVPFACVGETVKAHIIYDKKNYFIAKIVKVISQSSERVNPPCPYFGKCGGCDIQHINYNAQLSLKKEIGCTALLKYAKLDVVVNDVVKSNNEFRYRNKFSFPVQQSADGKIQIGMFRKNSHKIIEIDDCLLQSKNTKIIIALFKKFMVENNISGYNEETKQGIIKHIVVRENADAFILTVVVTDEKFNNFSPLIELLKSKFENFGIVKNVNNMQNNVIFGNLDINIYGLTEIQRNDFGIEYCINNRSFLQVNDYIKNRIYEDILNLTNLSEVVIDAYSGAGLLSAIMAKNSKRVYGIEIVKEATENAENLKKINKLNNLININGDCAKVLPNLAREIKSDFTLVLDPPRKGIDKTVLDSILLSKPSRIVYLSCNPATLARDLNYLKDVYNINMVQPYDMFPQTSNVETLVSLSLRG